jgi:tRNA A-37 threonylcarbamoyl transferase component Bud32
VDKRVKQHFHTSWYSSLDLRLLLVVMVVGLILVQWRPPQWAAPSIAIKEVGQWLAPVARSTPGVAVLTVERPELALWGLSNDADDSTDYALVKALTALAPQVDTIGVVLPYPADSVHLSSNFLAASTETKQLDSLSGLRRQLEQQSRVRQLLQEGKLVLGLSGGRVASQQPVATEPDQWDALPQGVRHWLWPLAQPPISTVFPPSKQDYFPVLSGQQAEQPLIFESDGRIYPGFALAVLRQSEAASADGQDEQSPPVSWQPQKGLTLNGQLKVPTSVTGDVVPLVTGYSAMSPSFAHLTLSAAISRPVTQPIVLIGSADDPLIERLAANIVALRQGLILTEPYWFAPSQSAALVVVLAFLVYVLPRLSWVAGFFVSFTAASAVAATQLWAQMAHGWWLPAADLLWVFAIGFVVMQAWQLKHSARLVTQRHLGALGIAHAQQLTQLGALEQAQHTLLSYVPRDQLYKPYLQLAEAFASQGLYREALDTLSVLEPSQSKSSELHSKQQEWEVLAKTQGQSREKVTLLAATQVLEPEPSKILGRYELKREIGRGATGTVYLGFDPKIARNVAIKTLDLNQFEESQLKDIKARFFREAEAAGRLSHPNIVPVFDVGEEKNLAFIAMDYVEGQALNHFVAPTQLLAPFEVYRVIADAARALHYAHENNIIHRDVKPANIIYCAEPYQLKVTDFGIARLVGESRTSTGEVLGSPLYIAPEQLQGKTVTPAADIFSLGVTFYQLLTGEPPFRAESLAGLTYEILYSKPQSVRKLRPDLPASATRIINRALQKDAAKRYSSALEMAEAIERALRKDFARTAKAAGF